MKGTDAGDRTIWNNVVGRAKLPSKQNSKCRQNVWENVAHADRHRLHCFKVQFTKIPAATERWQQEEQHEIFNLRSRWHDPNRAEGTVALTSAFSYTETVFVMTSSDVSLCEISRLKMTDLLHLGWNSSFQTTQPLQSIGWKKVTFLLFLLTSQHHNNRIYMWTGLLCCYNININDNWQTCL